MAAGRSGHSGCGPGCRSVCAHLVFPVARITAGGRIAREIPSRGESTQFPRRAECDGHIHRDSLGHFRGLSYLGKPLTMNVFMSSVRVGMIPHSVYVRYRLEVEWYLDWARQRKAWAAAGPAVLAGAGKAIQCRNTQTPRCGVAAGARRPAREKKYSSLCVLKQEGYCESSRVGCARRRASPKKDNSVWPRNAQV
jgi:hypothetical protein